MGSSVDGKITIHLESHKPFVIDGGLHTYGLKALVREMSILRALLYEVWHSSPSLPVSSVCMIQWFYKPFLTVAAMATNVDRHLPKIVQPLKED